MIIEKKLCNIVEMNDWSKLAHLFIDHGRKVCIANRPKCSMCVISVLFLCFCSVICVLCFMLLLYFVVFLMFQKNMSYR